MKDEYVRQNKIPLIELLYLCEDSFNKDIQEIRSTYGINVDSEGIVDINDFLNFDRRLILNETFYDKYENKINLLVDKHNLLDYKNDVEIFVESGISHYQIEFLTNDPTNKRISSLITKPEYKLRIRDIKGEGFIVTFVIRKYLETKDLDTWYKNNKNNIMLEVNNHFSGMKPALKINNKASRIIEIIKMKSINPKITYKEIADYMCLKYPDDPDVIDATLNEFSVKQIFYRYKNRHK